MSDEVAAAASRTWSLAHLTVLELTPPEVVTTAAAAGYACAGLRLSPARPGEIQHDMIGNTSMRRETLARMAGTGVKVLDIEVLWLDARRDAADYLPVLEAGAALGARFALTIADFVDEAAATAQFARLCELAASLSICCALEFMPWIGVNTLTAARRVVLQAGQSNGRLLVDPFHLYRSGGSASDLVSVAKPLLAYAQFCDAPLLPADTRLKAIAEEAKFERLFPGNGGLPLADFVKALPMGSPLSIEVPTRELAKQMPALDRARQALRSARRVLHSP